MSVPGSLATLMGAGRTGRFIPVNFGRGDEFIPVVVPTMTPQELAVIERLPESMPIPPVLAQKAIAFELERRGMMPRATGMGGPTAALSPTQPERTAPQREVIAAAKHPLEPTLRPGEWEQMSPQARRERLQGQLYAMAESGLMMGAPHVPGYERMPLEQTVAGATPITRRRTIPVEVAQGRAQPVLPRGQAGPSGAGTLGDLIRASAAERLSQGEFTRQKDVAKQRNRYLVTFGEPEGKVRTKKGQPIEYAIPPKQAELLEFTTPEGKPFFIGRITPEAWMRKQEAWVGPRGSQEWNETRAWYAKLRGEFEKVYGNELADPMLALWGLSQQRASPSGGMVNVLRAMDIVNGWRSEMGEKAGLAHDRLIAALKSGDPTVGEKLADFSDAIHQRPLRQWTGRDPRTGEPAPTDVHAGRDLGYIDSTVINRARKIAGPEVAKRLKADLPQAPSAGQYAYSLRFYNQMAQELNRNLRPDEKPYNAWEAQAIGWVGQQRMMGDRPEQPGSIFLGEAGGRTYPNVSHSTIEAAPGAGTDVGRFWESIPEAKRSQFTYSTVQQYAPEIARWAGVALRERFPSVGVWEQGTPAPNVGFQVVGTPEGAVRFAKAMAYAFRQTEVWVHRSATRPNANAVAVDIKAPEGYNLNKPGEIERFWRDSGLADVPGIGASQVRVLDGDVLRVIASRNLVGMSSTLPPPIGKGKQRIQYQGPRGSKAMIEEGRDFEALAAPVTDALAKSSIKEIEYTLRGLDLRIAHNDWTAKEGRNGEAHLQGLEGRGRAGLDDIARRVVESYRLAAEPYSAGARRGRGRLRDDQLRGVEEAPPPPGSLGSLIGGTRSPGGRRPPSAQGVAGATQAAQQGAVEAVRGVLTPDLLKPEFKGGPNPSGGHCYAASEAVYHLLGGKESGYTPVNLKHEGVSHWFLRGPKGEIIDPTADQFSTPVPYDQGRGTGFLTKEPSKRAAEIIRRTGLSLPR